MTNNMIKSKIENDILADEMRNLETKLHNEIVKAAKTTKWSYSPELVKYLRSFDKFEKQLNKLARIKDEDLLASKYKKILVNAINWLGDIPICKSVNAGKNKKAKIAANSVIKKSVPRLFKYSLKWGYQIDMINLCFQDCSDHLELAIALYEGKLNKAYNLSDMDTGSREEIPNKAWDFIQGID